MAKRRIFFRTSKRHINIINQTGAAMNKTELIEMVKEDAGSVQKAKLIIDSLIGNITHSLANNEEVRLPGFGTFKVAVRKAREGVHPQTGKKIKISEKKVIKFSPHTKLKEAVQ